MSPVDSGQVLNHILLVAAFIAMTLGLLRLTGHILVTLRAVQGMLFSSAITIASAATLWIVIYIMHIQPDTMEMVLFLNIFTNQTNELLLILTTLVSPFYFWAEQKIGLTTEPHHLPDNHKIQLKPHFVFNVLNSIAHLITLQPNKAEKALYNIADIFRVVLTDNRKIVPFRAELELAEKYLYLEKTRLDKRLQMVSTIDPNSLDINVPVLFLQPLLEKAVFHGIETQIDGGTIKLFTQVTNNKLTIQITNPSSKERLPMDQTDSLIHKNIKRRLRELFGNQYFFDTHQTIEDYTVTIKLPL